MAIRNFRSRERDIKVRLDESTNVPVPDYVNAARKRFSYDLDSRTLSKQCPTCLEWFPVAKLEKDGSWSDIHSEEAVHFDGKTYRSDCNHCYQMKRSDKAEKDEKSLKSQPLRNSDKSANFAMAKKSVYISPEDFRYLRMCAADLDSTLGKALAEIIARDRKERKFER